MEEKAPREFVSKSDFELLLSELANNLGRSNTPAEAFLIMTQLKSLLKEMEVWINKEQADDSLFKRTEAYLEDMKTRGPKVPLKVEGGAFDILRRAKQAADKGGWTSEQWETFFNKAASGDYENVFSKAYENFLLVTMDYFDWEKGDKLV